MVYHREPAEPERRKILYPKYRRGQEAGGALRAGFCVVAAI
jgi:hypothetical protein